MKKNELLYKKQAMARSIAENNSRNLWSECRRIRQKISISPINYMLCLFIFYFSLLY